MSNIVFPSNYNFFINGKWVDAKQKKTFVVINPCTEQEICKVQEATEEDVNLAVNAARAALDGKWKTMGAVGRRNLLLKLAQIIEDNADSLANLESFNNGCPLSFQGHVVKGLADDLRYYAGWADKIDGRVPPSVSSSFLHTYTRKEPVGVCGLILPWNVPLWVLVTKLGPCLATGNTAVIKPAEQTPLTALRFAELIQQAGFPHGVVNVVNGRGSTGALISHHMDIDKVAFTGSTEVGRLIMKAAAESNLKRVQLELGGKSPLIVFPDVDIEKAANIACKAVFENNGQICIAGSRTYVHTSIYSRFVSLAVKIAESRTIGDPSKCDQGPLVDKSQFEKVLHMISEGERQGAKKEFGGVRVGSKGYFIQPTVFSNVKEDNILAREEIFGPVMSVIEFNDNDKIFDQANNTPHPGVLTNDINIIFESNKIKAGTLWINTYLPVFPHLEFGGYKQSGFGREGGVDGISEWTQTKSVIISPRL